MRFIAHLDMDAFYASVELLRYPELRGKPLVIGGRRVSRYEGEFARLHQYSGRGVITTATYEARAFGVHSGMSLMKAAKRAPDAFLLPADFDEYRRYSRLFKDAVQALCPTVEDRGIDEIYIDLTAAVGVNDIASSWSRARDIAESLQRAVRAATGLSCSIGVTPNKLLSKIASDLEKPGGLTLVTESDIVPRIWPLSVRKISGIGPKANLRLQKLGIDNIGQLATAAPSLLIEHFGQAHGAWMHEAANGRDDRPVVTHSEPKSISRETTFERDLHPLADRAELSGIFSELCASLAADLQRKGYVGRTVGLKLRYDNFRTVTRDCTLEQSTADSAEIRQAAGGCLRRVSLDRRIRLLGVRMGSLTKRDAQPIETAASVVLAPTLFD